MGTPLHETIADQNYYVQVPTDVAAHEEVRDCAARQGLRFVDPQTLYLIVADAVLQSRDGWEDLEPKADLLAAEDPDERNRLTIAVSKRRKFIQAALAKTSFGTDEPSHITYEEQPVEPESYDDSRHTLCGIIETSKAAQDQIWTWIRAQAAGTGGLLVLGEDATKVDSTEFQVLSPNIPEGTTAEDVTPSLVQTRANNLLRAAARNIIHGRRIAEEQSRLEIPRESFVWAGNDLITTVRGAARDEIINTCNRYRANGVTEFDVATQVMMHLPTYQATDLWQGNNAAIEHVCDLLAEQKGAEANELLAKLIADGRISLNAALLHKEIERHAQKLAAHYSGLRTIVGDTEVALPASYMGDPERNPFKDFERAEIDRRGQKIVGEGTPGVSMQMLERHSGKTITFRAIPFEISKLYSLGFSNLHYARDGEIAAYGAFLEDDELPFAYSSYSPVTRQYTKDMLAHLEIDPTTIVESTRAWNASWAPENTMSTLFAFAHAALKTQRAADIKAGSKQRELGGVITSINPNLGFKAVSFRGVRFNVAGVKPTGFSYLQGADGTADFMPKNVIKDALGTATDAELEAHPRYQTATIPLLPTMELVALFDSRAEAALLRKPIYYTTPEAAKRG